MRAWDNRGEGQAAPAASPPPDGPQCCFCGTVTRDGACWTDPGGNVLAACRPCTTWLGEKELGLQS